MERLAHPVSTGTFCAAAKLLLVLTALLVTPTQAPAQTATVPGLPGLTVTPTGDYEVTLSWTAPADTGGAEIIRYEYRRLGRHWNVVTLELSGHFLPPPEGFSGHPNYFRPDLAESGRFSSSAEKGLPAGVHHTFELRAVNSVGAGPAAMATATPTGVPGARSPGAPEGLMATPGDRQVTLSWTPPADTGVPEMSHYQYAWWTKNWDNIDSGVVVLNWDYIDHGLVGVEENQVIVTGLTNGVTYRFDLRGVNRFPWGSPGTAYAYGTPTADPVSAPGLPGLTATPAGDYEVRLSWTAPADTGGLQITSYEYRWKTNDGEFTVWRELYQQRYYLRWDGSYAIVARLLVSDGEWEVLDAGYPVQGALLSLTGLPAGVPHTFELRAVNSGGAGPAAMATATPTGVPSPGAPEGLTATPAGDYEVRLSWTPPADTGGLQITHYEYRWKTNDGEFTIWTRLYPADPVLGLFVFFFDGFTAGGPHTFELRAVNSGGAGPAAMATATPTGVPGARSPGAPEGLMATPGDRQVTLSWTPPADTGGLQITHYNIHWGLSKGRGLTHQISVTGIENQVIVTGLTNGVPYAFYVSAVNDAGESPGTWFGFITPTDGIPPPQQADPVLITGDPSNRIDLVIISAGYTASERGQFALAVNALRDGLFAEDPFTEYASYFNIWKLEVPINAYAPFNCGGAGRPLWLCILNSTRKLAAVRDLLPAARDNIVVLVNEPTGTGGALASVGTGIAVVSIANNSIPRFVNTVLHELGHSLGHLADEYSSLYDKLSFSVCAPNGEPPAANVTRETNPSAIKWRRWIDSATSIPTTTPSEGVPGLYEGAYYCKFDTFRPTWKSKMISTVDPWHQINTEQLVRVFYDYVSPIDAWTPSTTQFMLPRGRSQAFAVTPMSPETHEIQVGWSVDGTPMGSGSSFILDTTALAIGDHVVTAGAFDNTPMVRSDPFQVLAAQQRWTVTIAPVAPESFSIRDRGGWSTTSSGTAETVRVGYGRIRADAGSTTPSGIAIFQFRDSQEVLISEASVPAAELIQAGRIFAEVGGPVNTGLAIANPNDEAAIIRFYFTDTDGTNVGSGAFELGAHQQTAKFLDQPPFNGGSTVLGTFTFESSAPIAVIALRGFTNETGEFLMTTLPVSLLSSASEETVYFPHFAAGGGWVTQVILVNPTDSTITGTVGFLGKGSDTVAASPVILTLDDGSTGSEFDYLIPPRSSQRFTTGIPSGALKSGSVRATPKSGNAAASGLVVFSYTSGGKTLSEAGVPALPKGSAFRVYVEASGTPGQMGSISSGLAITNVADTSNTVTLEVTHLNGSPAVTPTTLALPPSGQVARFLNEFFPSLTLPFSGILRIASTPLSPFHSRTPDIAVVGIRMTINERNDVLVTTTPPSEEDFATTSSDFFFPHFADSGGWTTQFILFSGSTGQASSGTLSFIDASGQPLDLTSQP